PSRRSFRAAVLSDAKGYSVVGIALFRNALPSHVRRLVLPCGNARSEGVERRAAVRWLITVGDPQHEAGEDDGCEFHDLKRALNIFGIRRCNGRRPLPIQTCIPFRCGQFLGLTSFRSSFRDWVAELGDFPNELLDTRGRRQGRSAYRRGGKLQKRDQDE